MITKTIYEEEYNKLDFYQKLELRLKEKEQDYINLQKRVEKTLKEKDKIIKEKDEIIKEKDEIIKDLTEKLSKFNKKDE